MKWYFGVETRQPLNPQKRVLTIGNFDGVHRGHQKLIAEVVRVAKTLPGQAGLITFHPHPLQVLFPEKNHHRLFDLDDQKHQLEKCGLDFAWVQAFSREFSELSSEEFLENFLWKFFRPNTLIVGYDFSFGRDRQGGREELKSFCEQKKIHFEVMTAERENGEVISTSLIRKNLQAGKLEVVENLLGRKYYLKGIVERGEQRGKLLGIPTANIHPVVESYPRLGVYVTRTKCQGQWLPSVTNIGMNRTFVEGDLNPVKVETHLLDWSKDIYGSEIQIELLQFIRDEKKFDSIDALKKQIHADIAFARRTH